jgi:hypothetical protein
MPNRILALLPLFAATTNAPAIDPPPKAPSQQKVDPKGVSADLADWTPRPAVGYAEPWEKATDKDWIDGRFREMKTGPFLNASFRYPFGKGMETVYKGTAIKLNSEGTAGVIFDRSTLRLVAAWDGGWLNISDRRFGLLNTPTPKGTMLFSFPPGPGWADANGKWETNQKRLTAPLPAEQAKFLGLYPVAHQVLLRYRVNGTEVVDWIGELREKSETHRLLGIYRALQIEQRTTPLSVMLPRNDYRPAGKTVVFSQTTSATVATIPAGTPISYLCLQPSNSGLIVRGIQSDMISDPGLRWGKPLVTDLVRGSDAGPFAIDTLTIPYANPHKALFFCTGLDFLPDGRIAMCTCHGDVWLVRVDEAAGKCYWQRFATGLYQPLGLKVVDGKIVVLERGQLTRLHDHNNDGEADFYECVNNDWHTGGGEHSYDTCLETDPAGNFYFFKTGDTETPSGGCLLRVTKDGSKAEIVATGFRHPIGLGISPTGIVTGADQEGNWMPATRIDQYKPGGFYGDMRAHHRKEPPKIYDGPLCWLPREVDNSAGGQVWVPEKSNWPLAGLPLHFSYGRCKAFLLLRQELPDGTVQGGATDLHLNFLSGVCRGRFHPADGHLYVCGLNGWQTAAKADGCLQRVCYTGKPLDVPVKMEVVTDGVKLTFSRPLDKAKASDPSNYRAAWWNYHWTGDYGSKRYKVTDGREGQDDLPVKAAELLADGRTVLVKVGPVKPVMQMQVGYNVAAADGARIVGSVYLTVHKAR